MPLLKRKPVELVAPPNEEDYGGETAVFYLAATGEIFTEYEDYSQRLSFYRQQIFQCELSGKINMTYFEAVRSEQQQSAAVHKQFPEALKGPILRSVQFYVTGRLDNLVDLIFDRFKNRFFPNEKLIVDIGGDKWLARVKGVFPHRSLIKYHNEAEAQARQMDAEANKVKREAERMETDDADSTSDLSDLPEEKVEVPVEEIIHRIGTDLNVDIKDANSIDNPNDYIYTIQLEDLNQSGDFSSTLMERKADALSRDRLSFSKTILKKYIKECVVRDASIGSPWIVRQVLAKRYGIALTPSDAVVRKNELIKEGKLSKRRKVTDDDNNEESVTKSGKKRRKAKGEPESEEAKEAREAKAKAQKEKEEEEERRKAEEKRKRNIKYPIEDLQLEAISDRELKAKGKEDEDVQRRRDRPIPSKDLSISTEVFEPLMNSYHFLQACGKPLALSPFSLDDYEAALRHSSPDTPCILIAEVHAALINVIVRDGSPRKESPSPPPAAGVATRNGTSHHATASKAAALAKLEFDSDDNESGEEEDSEAEADEIDSRASSVADSTDVSEPPEAAAPETEMDENDVFAAAKKYGKSWDKRLLKGDNHREGWEYSLCGALSKRGEPERFPRLIGILSHLTGIVQRSEEEGGHRVNDNYLTPVQRYPTLTLEDKISIVSFLCDQAVMTKPIKRFFDDCEVALTELRKERVELSRARKKLLEERTAFEEGQRKDDDKEDGDASKQEEGEAQEESDGTGNDAITAKGTKGANGSAKKANAAAANGKNNSDEEDELQSSAGEEDDEDDEDEDAEVDDADSDRSRSRSLARSSSRATTREASSDELPSRRQFGSRQEALREKAMQREAEEAQRAADRIKAKEEQRLRLAENRQIAQERRRFDEEEMRIQRREEAIDREFRKYSQAPRLLPLGRDRFFDRYWWFDGVGAASLLGPGGAVTYSTGRLYVQGVNAEEWTAICASNEQGALQLDERRKNEHQEEGLLQSDEWAVYSEPEQIDELTSWLRAKGNRENALRIQLARFRPYLQAGMRRRLHDLAGGWRDNFETRRSARAKTEASNTMRLPYMMYRNTKQ